MIFLKDAKDLRFARFNRAGENLLGYSRSDLIGKSDYDLFPKKQADHFTGKDREVLSGKKILDIPEENMQTLNKGSASCTRRKFRSWTRMENRVPAWYLGGHHRA